MTRENHPSTAHRALTARLDRRTLFGLGGATAVGATAAALAGAGPAAASAPCVDESSLTLVRNIDGVPMYYEPDGRAAGASFNPAFLDRVVAWKKFWDENTPYPAMDKFRHYGGYNNRQDGCVSYHNFGRAFDLTSAWTGDTRHYTFRYDIWKSWSGAELERVRKQYWTAAASCNLYFAHTLTYLFNTAHHNHIHIDNAASGTNLSTYSGTGVQVTSLQAILNYVWGKGTEVDGVYGPISKQHAAEVLETIGQGGSLATGSTTEWRALMTASVRQGSGQQTY